MLLCIMENDLALLLACMPAVKQCSGEWSAGTSHLHRALSAVEAQLTSICIYSFCSALDLPPFCNSYIFILPRFLLVWIAHHNGFKMFPLQRGTPCCRSIPRPTGAVHLFLSFTAECMMFHSSVPFRLLNQEFSY